MRALRVRLNIHTEDSQQGANAIACLHIRQQRNQNPSIQNEMNLVTTSDIYTVIYGFCCISQNEMCVHQQNSFCNIKCEDMGK